ncbi:MAG: ABC transporter permease [Actinomycetota bacterium]|nr:ABC transporter permease [Actinomycetota bacterium]
MSLRNPPRPAGDFSETGETQLDEFGQTKRRSPWRWSRRSNHLPWVSIFIVVVVLILPALFAGLITTHDPLRGELADRLIPPAWAEGGSLTYPLGTDKQGRDILTRMIYGARISLTVSSLTILIGAVVGSTLGLLAGYFGGWIDRIVSWLIDTFLSLPHVLLALVIVAAIGPSFVTIIAIIAITIWASFARQVRGETLSVRETEYVARARVAGASSFRILLRHVLPNVANTLIVLATLQVGVVILEESSLSFIGAGIPRPNPSWGVMVADGRDQILTAWWISFFPGLAILLVVLSLNLMGDWLRDFLDPKMRQRQ